MNLDMLSFQMLGWTDQFVMN